MLAAVIRAPKKLDITEVPTPSAGPGEVLLKVGSNTVCGTDLRILRGEKTAGVRPGVVLGHEIAGTIAEVGAGVNGYHVGDSAVVSPTVTCGNCYYCLRDLEQFCMFPDIFGYNLDGGLAEYCLIPAHVVARHHLVVAKPDVPATALSLSEPLSCVLNGAENYKVKLGDTAVIIGAGPIGILHMIVCRLAGATQIIVSDPSEGRRATAASLGADITVDPLNEDLEAVVRGATDGLGADVAVICIGRSELLPQAIGLTRKGGHVCAFAGFPKGTTASIDPNAIHYNQISIVGSSNAKRRHAEEALRLIEKGLVPADIIVSHTFPLEKAVDAIEFSASGEGIKVAVTP
ncbi:MAG: alcohol dehydrogenase catalytic domain-containing protein [Acidipropionibacterium sp.]|jgi:L-iditol 2-dehydrogenase|nr:alcohol dehydrogenase catalytic domain-containing protein [Acidipropionibacterium sp.]